MSDQPKYLKQWERVCRWFERFEKISRSHPHDHNPELDHDDVYAFFQNCYHLKDWIKNDAPSEMAQTVEGYINQHASSLGICGDLCNSLKHCELTRKPRTPVAPQFGPKKYHVGLGSGPTTIATSYSIVTTEGIFDAFEIASECMHAWAKFLKVQWPSIEHDMIESAANVGSST